MRSFFIRLSNFLVYSNIFISVCACACAAESFLLISAKINWLYLLFVFFSTLSLYLFPALIEGNYFKDQAGRHEWILTNRKFLILVFGLATLTSGALLFSFPIQFTYWFVPLGVIALAYFIPRYGLRTMVGLNAGSVAFVWMGVTAFFPLFLSAGMDINQVEQPMFWMLLMMNFLFIFPLCVIYNVRDLSMDRAAGIRTIPIVFGVKMSILISLISLTGFLLICFYSPMPQESKLAMAFSGLAAAGLLVFASEKRSDFYYSFWIDGMILLQFGILLLSKSFS